MLLSEKELSTLKGLPSWLPLIDVCDSELEVDVLPAVVMNPDAGYTSAGHSTDELSDRLSTVGAAAYRAALCYKLTGEKKYGENAVRIINSWYRTLRRIEGNQGQGVIGFHFLYYVVAGDWVRGVSGFDAGAFGDFLNEVILPCTRIDYKNNIAGWWAALSAGIHAYNNNYDGLQFVADKWREQVTEQVCTGSNSICSASFAADMLLSTKIWTLPEEITRSNTNNFNGGATKGIKGMDYTHFAMRAWTLCLEILLKEGINLYETDEARYFQNVFNKVVTWVKDPILSPYYARNGGELTNIMKVDYFAPLALRFTAETEEDGVAISKANDILDNGANLKPFIGDRWQLDLLFRGNYNAPLV